MKKATSREVMAVAITLAATVGVLTRLFQIRTSSDGESETKGGANSTPIKRMRDKRFGGSNPSDTLLEKLGEKPLPGSSRQEKIDWILKKVLVEDVLTEERFRKGSNSKLADILSFMTRKVVVSVMPFTEYHEDIYKEIPRTDQELVVVLKRLGFWATVCKNLDRAEQYKCYLRGCRKRRRQPIELSVRRQRKTPIKYLEEKFENEKTKRVKVY